MKWSRWLTHFGVFFVFVTVLVGWALPVDIEVKLIFIVIGIILSFIVIGLGEILHYLYNKKEK